MLAARQRLFTLVAGLLLSLAGCGSDEIVIPTEAEPLDNVQHSASTPVKD